MTKKLSLTDFRAVRIILEPDDFALGGDGPEEPPTDLIDNEVWDSLMILPDDVAIRTSNHNGAKLSTLNTLSDIWIEAVGDPYEFDNEMDNMVGCMLDANDCFNAATFDMLHGFYRSAISNLRAALELLMMGAIGNLNPDDKCYRDWAEGNKSASFNSCRDRLRHIHRNSDIEDLFSNKAFPTLIYNELCDFSHARQGSTEGALWESNGPIYSPEGMLKTYQLILSVYATSYLLVKLSRKEFKLPTECSFLFEDEVTKFHTEILAAYKKLYPETRP